MALWRGLPFAWPSGRPFAIGAFASAPFSNVTPPRPCPSSQALATERAASSSASLVVVPRSPRMMQPSGGMPETHKT